MEKIEKKIIEVLNGRNDVTRRELKEAIKKAFNGVEEMDVDYVINKMIGGGNLRAMQVAKNGDSVNNDDFILTIPPIRPVPLPPNQPH